MTYFASSDFSSVKGKNFPHGSKILSSLRRSFSGHHGFNSPLRQYYSLYIRPSPKDRKRKVHYGWASLSSDANRKLQNLFFFVK